MSDRAGGARTTSSKSHFSKWGWGFAPHNPRPGGWGLHSPLCRGVTAASPGVLRGCLHHILFKHHGSKALLEVDHQLGTLLPPFTLKPTEDAATSTLTPNVSGGVLRT